MPSEIRVDTIESNNPPNNPTNFPHGIVVSSGYALTCSGNVNITGIVTATSFSGDGSNLINLPLITIQKAITQLFI